MSKMDRIIQRAREDLWLAQEKRNAEQIVVARRRLKRLLAEVLANPEDAA